MSQLNKTDRRDFLKNSVKGTFAVSIGAGTLGSFLESCSSTKNVITSPFKTGFDQKPLPYKYDALENVIDATTMEIHYTKHAAAYSKNLKDAVQAEGIDAARSLEDILANVSKYSAKVRNNGGGHYNHSLFWQFMSPDGGHEPSGQLADALKDKYGDFQGFMDAFGDKALGVFGSGWAWLQPDLSIVTTPNQDSPLNSSGPAPILGLDVWEHAYYLDYTYNRGDYIKAWWHVVNWPGVQARFESKT